MERLNLKDQFGNIDIYLFDQLLKGRIQKNQCILDAGCGNGRNHYFFTKEQFDISAFDANPMALNSAIQQAKENNYIGIHQFKVAQMEKIPFSDNSFDWVINIAVLHFAQNQAHFEQMLYELWRVCKPGGKVFIRLASSNGIEKLIKPLGNNRFLLPDGSERYLVSLDEMQDYTKSLQADLFEPIKTTNVQNLRCMSTWCLQKN